MQAERWAGGRGRRKEAGVPRSRRRTSSASRCDDGLKSCQVGQDRDGLHAAVSLDGLTQRRPPSLTLSLTQWRRHPGTERSTPISPLRNLTTEPDSTEPGKGVVARRGKPSEIVLPLIRKLNGG